MTNDFLFGILGRFASQQSDAWAYFEAFLDLMKTSQLGSRDAPYAYNKQEDCSPFARLFPAREACVVATKELAVMDAQLVETTIKT